MKKWIIILLIVTLSSLLFLYHNKRWQHQLDQLSQFKEQINSSVEIEEVEVELGQLNNIKDENITIKSPFQSDLVLQSLQEEKTKEVEKQAKEETDEKTNISRPTFRLLGILRNNSSALATIRAENGIERLTIGEVIGGYRLIEINVNNVIFETNGHKFTFWLGNNYNNDLRSDRREGGS